ncbi:hypothetical protein WME88_54650 [Sorangium sp. So ce216]
MGTAMSGYRCSKRWAAVCLLASAMVFRGAPARAAPGDTTTTPVQPLELPVEIEIELAPAASLKQAPLWKELVQLLRNPYTPVVRRPAFRQPGDPRGQNLPSLDVWPLDYNFLTSQPLRLRTSDGEVSWDQPGPMFDPDEVVPVDAFNVPVQLRTAIGELVVDDADNLVVSNPGNDPRIPPDGTIVAVPAVDASGRIVEGDDEGPVTELEAPLNEEDFLRPSTSVAGVPAPLRRFIGRRAAEVLGKALFWDMQVGSDGVQACGSCHFHAGVDDRTRNQLNPNHLGGDTTLQVKGPNQDVVASDFPFHKRVNPDIVGDGTDPAITVSDANDVMSSMGVAFRQFVDIPPIGGGAGRSFGPAQNGVRPLLPDIGDAVRDPIDEGKTDPSTFTFVDPATGQNLRRVEPRNTPTMHSSAFNFDNFWDGRARFHFNGGSVFGESDPQRHIFVGPVLGPISGATNRAIRPDLHPASTDPGDPGNQPVRIKFSSLASQAMGPPVSDFEMSFAGRSWAKLGKKLLQPSILQVLGSFGNSGGLGPLIQVVPLANQLVDPTDSVLGPFSGQRTRVGGPVDRPGTPGLNISYPALIRLAFAQRTWQNFSHHLDGAPCATDPFDGFCLRVASGPANPLDRSQFSQMEANFSLFFGLAVQMYEELLIPDDTPFDQFMDENPLAANGIGQPGEQGVLFPTLIRELVTGSADGQLNMVPGFGEDELFGFDIFAGGNLTAALPIGSPRNPAGFGSNPFTRSARCMLCHLGPEQTDHTSNIAHGLLKGDAEREFPTPPEILDPSGVFGLVPTGEPPGPFAVTSGLILEEEIAGTAQDAVEVEPRDFDVVDDPATPWDERIIAAPRKFAFGDQGIYNIGLRPTAEDLGRGGDDPFGWPLSRSALALKNVGGAEYDPRTGLPLPSFDPSDPGATLEETGGGLSFPDSTHTLQSINPGFERTPSDPQLPAYMAPWSNDLPAGELHPEIDELSFAPNTLTPPDGGPAIELGENLFGSDVHCGIFDPATFGSGPPSFGWGATDPVTGDLVPGKCPNSQSGVPGNFDTPFHGTWPTVNRVLRDGAFKAPQLRNVELTGPYFHTGSYLTLRQVVDFYMRAGDFPISNADSRDPHMVVVGLQAFGFGRTAGDDLAPFADALPDVASRYLEMPDTRAANDDGTPRTPEPATSTPEQAKVALVKFLLALTDQRVKFERAPFDRPEIFVPLDGSAPQNTGGRAQMIADPTRFRRVPAVGAGGNPTPLGGFLGVTNDPSASCTTEISHFCR